MNGLASIEWMSKRRLLVAVVALMAAAAAFKLGDEFRRLLFESRPDGAVDMHNLHRWVGLWFRGEPIFQKSNAALYPPATYIMLWPFLGWTSFAIARWIWAGAMVTGLTATVLLILRASGAETRIERIFVALLVLSINGTGVAVGNGQLILLILPAILAVTVLAERGTGSWVSDLAAASLLTWAMVKPSVTLPFLWIFAIGPKHWRVGLFLILIYLALNFIAASFQKEDLPTLIRSTLARASTATTQFPGTRNLHALLVVTALQRWLTLSSAIVFVALGALICFLRRANIWVLLGIAALVARMWTYHRVYDDVLIALAELALFQIAKRESSPVRRKIAGALLLLLALAMLCPARFLDYSGLSWSSESIWICAGIQTVLWLSTLGFLVNYARFDSKPRQETNGRVLQHAT
ncbi:MAG: hypothetical protein JWO45_1393 [Spartobacteria bacterium]|nr:hypothetical protein [Spartobacteria bacterium]